MHAADDDSIPIPHDAFRMPRGALQWKTPYRTVLLVLGGVYGTLVLAGGITPGFQSGSSSSEPLRLPLLAQLALGCAGLGALVWVLSRAVREVDKRPYVAIAPVFATFAGLVHTGLRVELASLGASSAVTAFGVLGVALIGGGLIARPDSQAQRLGWGVVIAPWLLLMVTLYLAKGAAPLAPVERAYVLGLLFSSLVLGAAGVASRTLRSALTQLSSPVSRQREEIRDVPTSVMPAPGVANESISVHQTIRARAVQLPRGPARLRWAALALAALAYLALRSLFHAEAPRAASSASAKAPPSAPVVQQLSPAPAGASAAERTREGADQHETKRVAPTPPETTPVASPTPARHTAAPAARKAVPARSAPPSPPGLPAWGNVAINIKTSSSSKATSPLKPAASIKPAKK